MPSGGHLIVGAEGLVGRHLRSTFPADRTTLSYHRSLGEPRLHLDVTDEAAVRDLLGSVAPRTILLAAAVAHVEACERDPVSTRRVNVGAAGPFAEWAAREGAALVVFSSEYVFDGTAGAYHEDDPVSPLNEYGRQKVELERIARRVERHLICRASGVFGWEPARKNFVCQLVDRISAGQPFTVPNDQLVTPTYAPSLASVVAELIRGQRWGTYHVAGPRILGRLEFATMVADTFGLRAALLVPRATSELGLLADRPRRAGLSDEKLRHALGYGLEDPGQALALMAASA